jgi:hypothetical protein
VKQWPGIRNDQTTIGGNGLSDARGVSYAVEGELQRRPGLSWAASVGGTSLGAFRTPFGAAWALLTQTDGAVVSIDLADSATGTLASGYAVDAPAVWWNAGPRAYVTNDFDPAQGWNGTWSALRQAGIAAPAASLAGPDSTAPGVTTAGAHRLRYRFLDSTSPGGAYRSDPSGSLEYTVAPGGEALTFTIGTAGTDIIRSDDPKVDTIHLEMTTVNGATFYVAETVANSASSVTVDVSDATLAQLELADAFGDFGHEPPPCCAWGFESKGIVFVGGFHPRTRIVSVTNASATVTLVSGGNFSTQWAGRLVRVGSDAQTYVVQVATATTLTLAVPYAGATDASVTATITARNPNRIYWTRRGLPESFSGAERARDVLVGSGDRLMGGADVTGEPYFFGQRSMARLVYRVDPGDAELVQVPTTHGVWNHRCVVGVDGAVFGWGPNGAWKLFGGAPRWISRPIDRTVAALINVDAMALAHASVDPVNKVIRWWFVGGGETEPRYALTHEIAGGRWTIDRYRQPLAASVVAADDTGSLTLLVSDAVHERTWHARGATDGVPLPSDGAYTGASGSTATVVQVNESLPTGAGTDLSGVILYRPGTDEERVIVSNTSAAITVSPAFATVPAEGEDLYAGAIPFAFTTDWWLGADAADKKRANLHLLTNPSSTGVARVYLYRDYSATPYVWTSTDRDLWGNGVGLVNGRNYLTVDLDTGTGDGFVQLPCPAEWSRALRAMVEVLSPAGTVAILDVRFAPQGRRDVVRAAQE